MLSRTAECLFWMARYMERAANNARKLEVGYRMSLTPNERIDVNTEWLSLLATSGSQDQFNELYDGVNAVNIESFLVYDQRNPSSIANCIRQARNNAREARTAITRDVWAAVNDAYLEFKKFERSRSKRPDLPSLSDWVKQHMDRLRGAYLNTQLNNDGSDFFNIGCYLERADNTARIVDIKYHVLLPTIDMVGNQVDKYQWSSLLRAVSAYRAFHWAYPGAQSPEKIADFLILNPACPRSLMHCIRQIKHHLERLSQFYGTYNEAMHLIALFNEELQTTSIPQLIENGLHQFLEQFIIKNNHLADSVSESFMFFER
jgi:uncharacterized alpha-E superfamily protein